MATKHTPGPLTSVRESEYLTNIETADGRVIGCAAGDWGDKPRSTRRS